MPRIFPPRKFSDVQPTRARKSIYNKNGQAVFKKKLALEVPRVHNPLALKDKKPGSYFETKPTNLFLGNSIRDKYPFKIFYTSKYTRKDGN